VQAESIRLWYWSSADFAHGRQPRHSSVAGATSLGLVASACEIRSGLVTRLLKWRFRSPSMLSPSSSGWSTSPACQGPARLRNKQVGGDLGISEGVTLDRSNEPC